jgi:crotonobetaine/carnitine-CoA ligase
MYSSGTTGRPKGIVRFNDLEIFKASLADRCRMSPDDVLYCPVPLFHGLGLNWVQMALWAGAPVYIRRRFSVSAFLPDVRAHGITAMPHVGTMISALLASPARDDDADTPLRLSFGVGAPASVWTTFEQRFGLSIVEFYGSTETGLIMFNPIGGRPGSIGVKEPDVDIRLLDGDGAEVPTGVPGEMLVRRHHQPHGELAYVGDGGDTAARDADGWWHTGDLVRADADGYHFFVGRAKDTIRRRGENVVPDDVERAANTYPGVVESAAVAMPSPLGEDDVRLFVVASDAHLSLDSLQAHLAAVLPRFMLPELIESIDELPRTATQKIQRQQLRERPLPTSPHPGGS